MPYDGGTISLAPSPGTLVRLAFLVKWCPWQDSHPHWTASEAVVSALDYMGVNWQPRVGSHHQPSASKADALLIELQGFFEMVGYPGAAPGSSCFQGKRVLLALSYPNEKWTCTPGSHWVRRLCRPLTRLFVLRTNEMVPSAGSAPAPPRSQQGMLLLHYEGCMKMEPPVGFAPT